MFLCIKLPAWKYRREVWSDNLSLLKCLNVFIAGQEVSGGVCCNHSA